MYLHIGNNYILNSEEIIGIFDIDISTIEKRMRDYLTVMQREGHIVDAAEDLPQSFILTEEKVYISGLSTGILKQRSI
ncbi:MAG: DUF370 domain-containing protein [Oscillospiraceae bacterium]|nr:DUF370 domain-containing protein [Oscillospiraceae bacterium]